MVPAMTPVHTLELVLALMAVAVVLAIAARRLHIPTAVSFVLGGIVLALTPGVPQIELDPDLSLALFLPPLLMSAAFFTSWREFRANLRPILLLALGAVAFTTATVGYVAHLMLPGLPLAACFALGAIVSPPDAVAAAAVLERLRMPPRIVTVLAGESLVNDATGLVLYRFAVAAALTGTFSPAAALGAFVLVAVGGIAVGLAIATAFVWAAPRLRDSHLEIVGSFLIAWTSYLAAEAVHVSGVLSTVACGIVVGYRQHALLSSRTRVQMRATWSFVVFVLESMVFILLGLSLNGVLRRLTPGAEWQLLPAAAAVALTVVLGRFVWVFSSAPLSRPPHLRRTNPVPPAPVLAAISWAGMRGVVSLAAALALPADFPGHDQIVVLTFAVILVTVLGQGTTLSPLIKALGVVSMRDPAALPLAARAREAAEHAALQAIRLRADDPLDGAIARDLMPDYEERAARNTFSTAAWGSGAARAEREARLNLRLYALDASRQHLLAMHRALELSDGELSTIEEELDFEELRLRGRTGQLA
jgi:CPA1 family monovalent cation:H+ antiporter